MATASINLRRPAYLLAAAVLLNVVLISINVTTSTGVPLLEAATFGSFAEIQRSLMETARSVGGLWSGYVDLRGTRDENERLHRELAAMHVRLQEERAEAGRAETYRRLLELKEQVRVQTEAAEVIAAAASPEFRTLTIDKGESDGIERDMAVISPLGAVGRIILPSARAAKVQLLVDRNAAAGALIERNRAQGVVIGVGGGLLEMQYVPGTADVVEGDVIITSGIDGIYPKGFAIGTVERVERGPGTYHVIGVRPAVDFARLEEVLVVLTRPAGRTTEPPGAKE